MLRAEGICDFHCGSLLANVCGGLTGGNLYLDAVQLGRGRGNRRLEMKLQRLSQIGQRIITVLPWLATSTLMACATYHSSSFHTLAMNVCFVASVSILVPQ